MATRKQLKADIENNCGVSLDWNGPASSKVPAWRFPPWKVADYLCVNNPSIGAIHNYVWSMAYAESESAANAAFNNLCGLID